MDRAERPSAHEPLLEVRDLRTWFSSDGGVARAVDGVNFRAGKGETLGIVGESGCGKTVTALSILGLVPRPAGRIVEGSSIRFRGRELTSLPERELRRIRGNEIAMIFQEPMTSLNPVFTVGEQIGESLRMHRGMGRREARRSGIAALHEVGIPEPEQRFDAYPFQLSGGMLQRVMIAMALSCEPDLLIADEPTTALDVTIQAQILDLLAAVRARRGMAMLLITHDLGVVAEVCDRVLVMYAGQVVEAGSVEDIFHRPRHPYTQGLLASLPRIDNAGRRLNPIDGTVPSPLNWPVGCRFHDRCPHAWSRCREEQPELVEAGEGGEERASRCWLEAEPERRTVSRGGAE
jgi:oligopeptide/dipeptide ABC transporter ATP-binding protein